MRDIELEEGEAFFIHDDDDDDENIDPDKDLSYIDRKIENVLGHYQKDFMAGLSPNSLGARYGGYGSFLPMQERSPPVLFNQRTPNHVTLKSPQNMHSENLPPQHSSRNPAVAVKTSLPAKDVPLPDQSGHSRAEAVISSMPNKSKFQNSVESVSNHHQQPNKPIIHHSEPNLLKFRVKMGSESVLSLDNSAIYSGLGLDISPCSSPDDSPLKNDIASPVLQELTAESPSIIIKMMTSMPFLKEELVSPLHNDLICLTKMENSVETGLPGLGHVETLDIIDECAQLDGKNEASKVELNVVKVKKPKQKHTNRERKMKLNVLMEKPAEPLKENHEFLENCRRSSASRNQEGGTFVADNVSHRSNPKEVDKNSDLRASALFVKKSDAGCGEDMDMYRKEVHVVEHKVRDEFGFGSSAVEEEKSGNKSKGRVEKNKNVVTTLKMEHNTDKRKEPGVKEDEVSRVSKSQSVVKIKVIGEDSDLDCPKETGVYMKVNGMREKVSKDEEKPVSLKDVKDNGKHYAFPQEVKFYGSEIPESPKQSLHSKGVPHVQMVPRSKEPSSSLRKKKLKDRNADDPPLDPSKDSLRVRSSAMDHEEVICGNNLLGKDNEAAVNENPSKKGKDLTSRNFAVGIRESQLHESKLKEQPSSKKSGIANTGPKFEGGLAGGNCLTDKVSVGELPPPENAVPLEMEDWVGCEKCEKWRLLPFGMNPKSLPKKWVCSMITWLHGMNKCSVSEEETTNALRAQYLLSGPVSGSQVNNQQAHLDTIGFVNALAAPQKFSLPNQATSTDVLPNRGKKKNLGRPEVDAAEQVGAQGLHRPTKKEQPDSGVIRHSKNLKKLPQETDSAKKIAAGDGRPLMVSTNKRMAECDVSRVPKKMKKEKQPVPNSDLFGLLPGDVRGESQHPDALPFSQDVVHGSSEYPLLKVKDSVRTGITVKNNERKVISEKKRKTMDQQERVISAEEFFDDQQLPLNTPVVGKERKPNTSNFEARESSADKGHRSTHGDVRKLNAGIATDGRKHKGARIGGNSLEQLHLGDRISQKTADARISSEKIADLGLSDNATTSSSSKVSSKVKLKAREVKCSPVGSNSSSPLKVRKSNTGKGTNKAVAAVSCHEPEEMSSRKRLKCADSASVPQDFVPPNEDTKDKKHNLSKTSGVIPKNDGNQFSKTSSGREPSSDRVNVHSKPVAYERSGGKLDQRFPEEETMALGQKPENHSSEGLHFDGKNSGREKFAVPGDSEKACFALPESEIGSMSNPGRVDNVGGKLSRLIVDDRVSLRHPHPIGHLPKDAEASSSKKKDCLPWDAKTALREATNLKHSANRLKTAGSGQSTGIFFQAALKFLHGASLLKPGNNENVRPGEMTAIEVYGSTAKLCEYCAHEFEKCNDMASAALAYKCMEFAYLRVIYYNDATASQDRLELQMAVRATPQVESPSSSASDIDNLNNLAAVDAARDGHPAVDHRNHVISAGNRPNFLRLLSFTHDINLAMEASRRSQSAFAAANSILSEAGNEECISSIKRVLDFSFHDVDGLLHLVRLAMEALEN